MSRSIIPIAVEHLVEEEEVDIITVFTDYMKDKPGRDLQIETSLLKSILAARLARTKSSKEVMQLSRKVEDCKETMNLYARYQKRMNEIIGHKNCKKSSELQRKLRLEREEYEWLHRDYSQLYDNYEQVVDFAKQQQAILLRLEEDISKEQKSREILKDNFCSVREGFISLLESKTRDVDNLLLKQKMEINAIVEECERNEAAILKYEEELNNKANDARVLKDIIEMLPSCNLGAPINSTLDESLI